MPEVGLLFKKNRNQIANIIIDATLSEEHSRNSDITDNPVEEGVDITDHVRVKPKELTMNCVISDTPLSLNVISGVATGFSNVAEQIAGRKLSQEAFDALEKLQEKREPIKIITGLKVYENMIISNMNIPRDFATANTINFSISFREIEIARLKRISKRINSGSRGLGSPKNDKGLIDIFINKEGQATIKGIFDKFNEIRESFGVFSGG